jgi:hypothetical protein
VGFSRAKPEHLGKLSSVGINCAICHLAEVEFPTTAKNGSFGGYPHRSVRVLGVTSHVNIEAFFGAVIAATFQTRDPANMKRFLREYLEVSDPARDADKRQAREAAFDAMWKRQASGIAAAMAADPDGAQGAGAGGLQALEAKQLRLDGKRIEMGVDLAEVAVSMLKLFHNMRKCVHVPDELPGQLPPPSGPGRNDAFGILAASLLRSPQAYAPVKFGVVWNVEHRHWVHWDGNTQSPLGRNFLAAVGLGAPLVGNEAKVEMAMIERQTAITEKLRAPRYPLEVDAAAARRGAGLYAANCAACHDGAEDDRRLYSLEEMGTDPQRARMVTPELAAQFDALLADLRAPGYTPEREPPVRSTGKYWAPSLAGVWARSPYLHNGSVRTMRELLTPPERRAETFHRGSKVFDEEAMGYEDGGSYVLDTRQPGNRATGHDYGTKLSVGEKGDLVAFLKTK